MEDTVCQVSGSPQYHFFNAGLLVSYRLPSARDWTPISSVVRLNDLLHPAHASVTPIHALSGRPPMSRSRLAVLAVLLFGCAEPTVPVPMETSQFHPGAVLSVIPNEAVLPSGYTTIMGETNNSFPQTQMNMRYQQVFAGSDIVDPTIVGLCLRRDDVFGGSQGTQTLTIKMGPSSLDYTNLTTNFDGNYSAAPTEVFSGDVVLPASAGDGTPTDFDLCIPFTQQYVHTPGNNVIVEVLNTSLTATASNRRDACAGDAVACTTARAFAFSATASTAVLAQRGGLVMKFISPLPPAPTDPTVADDCKKGGWADFGFRNQGQCVSFVETGNDSRS